MLVIPSRIIAKYTLVKGVNAGWNPASGANFKTNNSMKKVFITTVLLVTIIGCKKSNTEILIEEYELRQVKLSYLKDLMIIKSELDLEARQKTIDSLIFEEKNRINDTSN